MTLEEFVKQLEELDHDESPMNLIWDGEGSDFEIATQDDGAWESRWGIGREYVLEFKPVKPQLLPRFLQVSWEDGATEYQEDHPAGTTWVEVYPQEKTVTVYVTKKKHDDGKVETNTIPLF